jgi:hypothetical protein
MKSKVELNKQNKPRESGKILGVSFVSTQKNELIKYLLSSIQKGKKLSVVTPNPEILVAQTKDQHLKEALLTADIRIPDGEGIGLFLPLTTIKGRDLFSDLLTEANNHHLRVYFLGSSEKTISLLTKKVSDTFPHISFLAQSGLMFCNRVDRSRCAQRYRNEVTNRHLDNAANEVHVVNDASTAELREGKASHTSTTNLIARPRAVVELNL